MMFVLVCEWQDLEETLLTGKRENCLCLNQLSVVLEGFKIQCNHTLLLRACSQTIELYTWKLSGRGCQT